MLHMHTAESLTRSHKELAPLRLITTRYVEFNQQKQEGAHKLEL